MAVSRRALLRGGLTVTAVGALGATVPVAAGAAGARAVDRPQMYGCDEWGARPPNGTIEVLDHKPTYIVVHHTAGGNSADLSLEHAFSISRGIQNFHMDDRGYVDSGQQFTNSRGGHITEGRRRSLEILDGGTQHVMGAHVGNHNSETIGIENEGLYSTVDVTPELWNSLVQLVAYMAQQYGISPDMIRGHRDFNATECPGTVLYGRLPELREAVGAVLGVQVTHPENWPLLKPGDQGPKVLAAQHLLRGLGAPVEADGVFGASTFDAVKRISGGLAHDPCYASHSTDESGFIGAPTWPHLIRTVRANESTEFAKAARVLLAARRQQSPATQLVDTATWRRLLT